jgi:hypothetical protein
MPFAKAIPETYGAADQAAGLVWRAPPTEFIFDDTGRFKRVAYVATPSFQEDKDRVVQTLAVWSDLPSVGNYVCRDTRLAVLKQRADWMEKPARAQYVFWWGAIGAMPTHIDGLRRLELLDHAGPAQAAFSFRNAFSSTGEPEASRG